MDEQTKATKQVPVLGAFEDPYGPDLTVTWTEDELAALFGW